MGMEMNGGKSKQLSSGPSIGGSLESKIIIGLVIIAVIIGAIAFALYATNQSQGKQLDEKQADLDAANANLSQATSNYQALSASYAALNDNNTALNGQLATVKANYNNISALYLDLQNRSSAVDSRLNSFLENQPTIAYTYSTASKVLPNNTTDLVLTVTAYNLGKTDAGNIRVECTVREGNETNVYNQSFQYVMSLDKRQAVWEFGNDTSIISVWAGLV